MAPDRITPAAANAAAHATPPRGAAPAVPEWATPELLEKTRRVWQRRYARPLTHPELVEIVLNAGLLCDLLSNIPSGPSTRGAT